jgi:hypothetical protein
MFIDYLFATSLSFLYLLIYSSYLSIYVTQPSSSRVDSPFILLMSIGFVRGSNESILSTMIDELLMFYLNFFYMPC